MSQHSALASLTAQYTDSEEEAELEAEESSYVQILGKPPSSSSAANSPVADSGGGSNEPSLETQKLPVFPSLSTISQPAPSSSAATLVSYQDDLIDDDAVDDMHTSDSNTGQDETEDEDNKTAEGNNNDNNKEEDMEVTDKPIKNGDASEIEVVNLEDDASGGGGGGSSKKKSMIPPEPPGKCAPELQEKFSKMYEKKIKGGLDMNLAIQRNKNFRNPSIYEKLIKYCDIDELGSNYPRNVFDPHEWHESSYYDELAKAQKELMEKRERDRKERTKVDFVSGTVKKPAPPPPPASHVETEPKRKSKWDQRGVMPPLLLPSSTYNSQPPVTLPPNSASASKTTVINAFGNINRKQQK